MVNFKPIAATVMAFGLASGSVIAPEKRAEQGVQLSNLVQKTATTAEIAAAKYAVVSYCRDPFWGPPCTPPTMVALLQCNPITDNTYRAQISALINFHRATTTCAWYETDDCRGQRIISDFDENLYSKPYAGPYPGSNIPPTWNNRIRSFLCVGRKPEKSDEGKWDDYKGDHSDWETD